MDLAIVVPTLDPEWELAALTALMKPPRRAEVVANRRPEQEWTAQRAATAREVVMEASRRLGVPAEVIDAESGDLRWIARLASRDRDLFVALGAALSKALPEIWFKFDRVWVQGGAWKRRVRGTKLVLGPAAEIHVRRSLRSQLGDLL